MAWLMDGSRIAARSFDRGAYGDNNEPLARLHGCTVLRAGLAFRQGRRSGSPTSSCAA
jgi:hypothetical protein